jgi:hypothetical protein
MQLKPPVQAKVPVQPKVSVQVNPAAARLPASSVRRRLMAASCALLGASAARGQSGTSAPTAADELNVDSALAYYHENGRVQAIEPVVSLSKDFGDGKVFGLNLTFDSLSGSSPNGALPSRQSQTFASPSGKNFTTASKLYTTSPGNLPEDPNYHDTRFAGAANLQLPLDRLTQLTLGGKLSYEHDFFSLSGNASIAHDFNEKNTTVALGVNDEYDTLRPIGGTPVAGSAYSAFDKTGGEKKNGIGVLLGVTQVMNRNWLTEFNLSADRFTGYLNDPYKILSVIDASGNTLGYQYEHRPDERLRKSAYLENRVAWDGASAGLSLRYMTDDWQIHSETAQLHLRWWLDSQDKYLEPTLRWYKQTAANFYMPWILNTAIPSNDYASPDSRLGAFHALTYGLKYGEKLADQGGRTGAEFSARIEYYQQLTDTRAAAPGTLQGLDLTPGLKAILVQIGWRF